MWSSKCQYSNITCQSVIVFAVRCAISAITLLQTPIYCFYINSCFFNLKLVLIQLLLPTQQFLCAITNYFISKVVRGWFPRGREFLPIGTRVVPCISGHFLLRMHRIGQIYISTFGPAFDPEFKISPLFDYTHFGGAYLKICACFERKRLLLICNAKFRNSKASGGE